jgi:serine/threonine-protein kinase RsbW
MDTLVIPAKPDSLSLIRQYVAKVAEAAGLNELANYQLCLAVDEIATNVITYGYQENGQSGDICLRADLDAEKLTVIMEDTGIPFDPTAQELPTEEDLALPLEQRPIGGLGIFLTIKGVDEFRYEQQGNMNQNIFEMHLVS